MVGARAHKDCLSAESCAPLVFYFPLIYSALAHFHRSSPFTPSAAAWLQNKALLILSNLQSPTDNKFIVPTHISVLDHSPLLPAKDRTSPEFRAVVRYQPTASRHE